MVVPGAVMGMTVMLLMHGFFLDILIIGIVPFLSADAGDKSRLALFPWCLGGYPGFGAEKVPNLAPTHRRFIAENAAYAVLRGIPGLFVLYFPELAMSVLLMAVFSHFIEAVTIAWEIYAYNAPADSAPPMTLMGIFATWTLYICSTNPEGYLTVDPTLLTFMKVLVGLTWASWACGVVGVIKNKGKAPGMA